MKNIKVGKGILYRVQHEKPVLKGKFTFRDIEKVFKIKRKENNPRCRPGELCKMIFVHKIKTANKKDWVLELLACESRRCFVCAHRTYAARINILNKVLSCTKLHQNPI